MTNGHVVFRLVTNIPKFIALMNTENEIVIKKTIYLFYIFKSI